MNNHDFMHINNLYVIVLESNSWVVVEMLCTSSYLHQQLKNTRVDIMRCKRSIEAIMRQLGEEN